MVTFWQGPILNIANIHFISIQMTSQNKYTKISNESEQFGKTRADNLESIMNENISKVTWTGVWGKMNKTTTTTLSQKNSLFPIQFSIESKILEYPELEEENEDQRSHFHNVNNIRTRNDYNQLLSEIFISMDKKHSMFPDLSLWDNGRNSFCPFFGNSHYFGTTISKGRISETAGKAFFGNNTMKVFQNYFVHPRFQTGSSSTHSRTIVQPTLSNYSEPNKPPNILDEDGDKIDDVVINLPTRRRRNTYQPRLSELYCEMRLINRNQDGSLPPDVYECVQCKKIFGDQKSVSFHQSMIHFRENRNPTEQNSCDKCAQVFQSKTNQKRHKNICHPTLKSDKKGKAELNKRELELPCETCIRNGFRDAFFTSKNALAYHLKITHGNQKNDFDPETQSRSLYRCIFKEKDGETCGHYSAEKNNVERHIKSKHFRVKEYNCTLCNVQSFTTLSNLIVHQSSCAKRNQRKAEINYSF